MLNLRSGLTALGHLQQGLHTQTVHVSLDLRVVEWGREQFASGIGLYVDDQLRNQSRYVYAAHSMGLRTHSFVGATEKAAGGAVLLK